MFAQQLKGYLAGAVLIAVVWWMWPPLGMLCAALLLLGLVVRPVLYFRWINSHDLRSRELTKACHGAGILALAAVVVSEASLAAVSSNPALWIPLSVMTAWGGLWLVTSGLAFKRLGSQGPLDSVLIVRALVKIAIGGAVLRFLPFGVSQLLWGGLHILQAPDWTAAVVLLAYIAGWFVAFWCVVTGSTKLLLMLATQIRRRPKALADPSTHGRGRFAGAAEGSRVMQGQGRRSRMEGVKF